MERSEYKKIIEGLMYLWGDPLDISDISKILDLGKKETREILEEMTEEFNRDRGLLIKKYDDSYQFVTRDEYFDFYTKLIKPERKPKLSNSSMEVLSIIAYKQPITRIEIDNIRGVKSSSSINTLVKRDLIEEAGRLDTIGKPIVYRTSEKFLKYFDINSLDDLPRIDDIKKKEEEDKNRLEQLEMDDYEDK